MKNIDHTLLILKSLNGSITTEEKVTLNKWLDSDVQNQKVYDEISMIWSGAWEDNYTAIDEEHFLEQRERLMQRLSEVKKESESKQSFFKLFYPNVAAAVVIAVTITAFTSYLINKKTQHHIVSFQNANIQKISDVLKLDYGVKFQISNATSSCSFTGTFIDEDVQTIIESISKVIGFKVEFKNGIYFIKLPSKRLCFNNPTIQLCMTN